MRAGTAMATAGRGFLASTSIDAVHDKTRAAVASKVIRGRHRRKSEENEVVRAGGSLTSLEESWGPTCRSVRRPRLASDLLFSTFYPPSSLSCPGSVVCYS